MQTFDTSELDLNSLIHQAKTVVVVVSTQWCGPCNKMTPIWEEIEKEMPDVKVFKVDVTENIPKFVVDRGVRAVPTIIVFQNGMETNTSTGGKTKEEVKSMISFQGFQGLQILGK